MPEANALREAIKRQLKARGMTYSDLARAIGVSEPTVKRQLSRGGITLERLERICEALDTDFSELARSSERDRALPMRLEMAQERALAREPRLMLVFHLLCNDWRAEDIRARHGIPAHEMTLLLARLDRHGLIELQPGNRVRLRVSRRFTWRRNGPVLRRHGPRAIEEFLKGDFRRDPALLRLETRELSLRSMALLARRLERVAQEVHELAEADAMLPEDRRHNAGLVIGFRPWRFSLIELLASEETSASQAALAATGRAP